MNNNLQYMLQLKRTKRFTKSLRRQFASNWQLYLFVLPGVIYYLVFHYLPLYGVQIAFRDYKIAEGITGSKWVGLANFRTFFESYLSWTIIKNTLVLNLYSLLFSFPIPIIFSLLLNRIQSKAYKKFTQTVIYIPHFVSTVVLAGMLYIFLDPTFGFVNKIIETFGGEAKYFMADSSWFRTVFIASGIWQNAGWNTIVYLAALTGIDAELYEAAKIDGASILKQIQHIDLPSILPMAMMMLILNSGSIMAGNMQKTLLLQTPGNMEVSNTIGVYVYQMGLTNAQFSYTAAIGLFQNIVSFIMVCSVNFVSRKMSSISMF